MATTALRSTFSVLSFSRIKKPLSVVSLFADQERFYAKRSKIPSKSKNKLKKEDKPQKAEPWRPTKIDKSVIRLTRKDIESGYQPEPVDNVWLIKEHKPPLYDIGEILKMHQDTHHPTVYNEPDGLIYATLDLNMSMGPTKTKPLDAFRGVICYPNYFSSGSERRILSLCKDHTIQQEALKAGAVLSGGLEVIQMFKSNELSHTDFDHIVVHPDMLLEIVPIRGIIKHHFPTKQRGNLGPNVAELVHKFVKGVDYKTEKDLFEEQYATVVAMLGRLTMEEKAIEQNLVSLLLEINERRPPTADTPFITSVNIWSPPSVEKLFVNFWQHLSDYNHDTMLSNYTAVNYQRNV